MPLSPPAFAPAYGLTAGQWYGPYCTGTSAAIPGEANAYAVPLYVPKTTTFDRIGAVVTIGGGTGAVIRFGIYADNGRGQPGALVLDAGTVAATGTGTPLTITISQVLAPGLYWLVSCVQGVATPRPTMKITGTLVPYLPLAAGVATAESAWYMTGITGAFPAAFTVAGIDNGDPITVVRAA